MTPLEKIISTHQQKKSCLHEKYGVSEIAVFGSFARNDFTENSDVDLLMDFDRPIGWDFVSLADELEKILNKKLIYSQKAVSINITVHILKKICAMSEQFQN